MTRPTTIRGSKMLVKLGDGATPEVFTAPCALTTKSFNMSTSTNEFSVADCAAPDDPVWVERVKSARSASISGSGTLAKESLTLYNEAFLAQDAVNVEVKLDYAAGPITYHGAFHLTKFEVTGEQSGLVQVSLEMQSNGPVALS